MRRDWASGFDARPWGLTGRGLFVAMLLMPNCELCGRRTGNKGGLKVCLAVEVISFFCRSCPQFVGSIFAAVGAPSRLQHGSPSQSRISHALLHLQINRRNIHTIP